MIIVGFYDLQSRQSLIAARAQYPATSDARSQPLAYDIVVYGIFQRAVDADQATATYLRVYV